MLFRHLMKMIVSEGSDNVSSKQYRRKISPIFSTYGEMVRYEHEKKVNDRIDELSKIGTVVSIVPSRVGMKPIQVVYDLIYDEGRPSEHEYHRYLKSVLMLINEVQPKEHGGENLSESKVNEQIDRIYDAGGKVITIIPHNFGFSPVIVAYDIIYEAEKRIE